MLKELINTIEKKVVLNEENLLLCSKYFESLSPAKNTLLETQGKVPEYLYFIATGFMRLFYIDENGEENTSFISMQNGFITAFLPFINQIPSNENIACITDCEILRISNANLKILIEQSEHFKQFSLIIFEQAMHATAIRANDLATLNAEQRYKKLISQQPAFIQNVPIQYIASYLGMKPESLSRIRRQMIS